MDGYPNSIRSQCTESVNSSLNEKTCQKIRQSKEGLKVYLRQAHTHVYSHHQAYTHIPTSIYPWVHAHKTKKEIEYCLFNLLNLIIFSPDPTTLCFGKKMIPVDHFYK